MGPFFDLNLPSDPNQTPKQTRLKLALKTQELGYTAVAYTRTVKGVMSDGDRCSIPPFSLSSLLPHLPPSFSSSLRFHRDLLRVPRAEPFRQYARVTVVVESLSQAHALNSGNPVLKTYDVVAVRPLSQAAFDQACERCEVDIIAIDFTEKLPFRLRLPMIKAAKKRGVYFEILYSGLIGDAQVRRQMISNAKLLVDWTRGKNLIISSGAASVTEIRGPYDVANLFSLLGLSAERAKAAVSRNCRNLITNALRRKNFYKEAIRVELIPSGKISDLEEPFPADWLKWDPISSGDGDLQLDDIERSFSDIAGASKTVKPIDFASIVDGIPPDGGALFSGSKPSEASTPINSSKMSGEHCLFPQKRQVSSPNAQENQISCFVNFSELHFSSGAPTSIGFEGSRTSVSPSDGEMKNPSDTDHMAIEESSDLRLQSTFSADVDVMVQNESIECPTSSLQKILSVTCLGDDAKLDISLEELNVSTSPIEESLDAHGSDADNKIDDSHERPSPDASLIEKYATLHDPAHSFGMNGEMMDTSLKHHEEISSFEIDFGEEQPRKSEDATAERIECTPVVTSNDIELKFMASLNSEPILCEQNCASSDDIILVVGNGQGCEPAVVNVSDEEQHRKSGNDTIDEHMNYIPSVTISNDVEAKPAIAASYETPEELSARVHDHQQADATSTLFQQHDLNIDGISPDASDLLMSEVTIKEQSHEAGDIERSVPTPFPSLPGKSGAKRKVPSRQLMFPLSRLLNSTSFKKTRKTKRIIRMK